MIFILHGEDSLASYNKLQLLVDKYQSFQKIRFDEKTDKEQFTMALFSLDLIEENKLIICTNFISTKKIQKKDLINIPKSKQVIFWEKKKVGTKTISTNSVEISIEEFKLPSTLFYFLDAIASSPINSLQKLNNFTSGEARKMSWHLTNRFFLLILAKLELPLNRVNLLNLRPMQDWQWNKIKTQSAQFNLPLLQRMYSSLLKIDYLIKTGKTGLSEKTLISTLFLKYLRT